MEDLRVSLVQTSIEWENHQANLSHYSSLIADLKGKTDLVILPEMFATGFTMHPAKVAEQMDGASVQWMAAQAMALEAAITGSLAIEENGQYYNRLFWVEPDGQFQTYDKRHLFTMAGEHIPYTAGSSRLIVTYKGWRICPMICYDLRFPVWSRNNEAFDVLIYTANWPDKRAYHWLTLLKARAIENQCYTIGVNRVGTDANGHNYNGDCCIVDPGWLKTIFHAEVDTLVHTETLSASHLQSVRQKLPFLADQGDFQIRL